MTKAEADWLAAVAREVFRPDGPREDRIEMLKRGEIPQEDDRDVHG